MKCPKQTSESRLKRIKSIWDSCKTKYQEHQIKVEVAPSPGVPQSKFENQRRSSNFSRSILTGCNQDWYLELNKVYRTIVRMMLRAILACHEKIESMILTSISLMKILNRMVLSKNTLKSKRKKRKMILTNHHFQVIKPTNNYHQIPRPNMVISIWIISKSKNKSMMTTLSKKNHKQIKHHLKASKSHSKTSRKFHQRRKSTILFLKNRLRLIMRQEDLDKEEKQSERIR